MNPSPKSRRCFELPDVAITPPQKNIQKWMDRYAQQNICPTDDLLAENLAKILPFLHCGEQSAMTVFSNEISRLKPSDSEKCLLTLTSIINDEFYHDHLLQHTMNSLPQLRASERSRKRARLFYARLGSLHQISTHFQMIAELDANACHILNAMEHSKIGKRHPITQLFQLIKKDEARHVHFSKQRVRQLCAHKSDEYNISPSLIKLLETESETFEALGIDFDQLTQRILGKPPCRKKKRLKACA